MNNMKIGLWLKNHEGELVNLEKITSFEITFYHKGYNKEPEEYVVQACEAGHRIIAMTEPIPKEEAKKELAKIESILNVVPWEN